MREVIIFSLKFGWLLGDLMLGDPYLPDAVIAIGWTDSFFFGESSRSALDPDSLAIW